MILPTTWNIPEKIRQRFGETSGRQRAMLAEGHLVIVLHEQVETSQKHREAQMFWRDPTGVWCSSSKGGGIQALRRHLSEFSERYEQLESQLQSAKCATDYFNLLQIIAPLQRMTRNMHATLQQARDMIPDDRDIIVVRDTAGDIERSFELLYIDAKNGLEYTVAHKTELQSQRGYEMASAAHRLNLLAAIFLPITALASIFGMNVPHCLDGCPSKVSFWAILAVGAVAGFILALLIGQKTVPVEVPPKELPRKYNTGSPKPRQSLKVSRARL